MILIPDEFKTLCRHFHQDTFVLYRAWEGAVAAAVSGLTQEERNEVGKFLAKLLNGRHDDGELKRVWRHSGAELAFSGTRGVRPVFQLIHEEIGRKR